MRGLPRGYRRFYLLALIFGVAGTNLTIYLYTAIARLLSSLTNFTLNRNVVFRSRGSVGKTLLRYYTLAIPQLLLSAFFVERLTWRAHMGPFWTTVVKAVVDICLFIISFQIQREWVFRDREKGIEQNGK